MVEVVCWRKESRGMGEGTGMPGSCVPRTMPKRILLPQDVKHSSGQTCSSRTLWIRTRLDRV